MLLLLIYIILHNNTHDIMCDVTGIKIKVLPSMR